jgi:hypothetical protein
MNETTKIGIAVLIVIGIFYGIGGYAIYMFVNEWLVQYAPYGGAVGVVLYWFVVTMVLGYINILQQRITALVIK